MKGNAPCGLLEKIMSYLFELGHKGGGAGSKLQLFYRHVHVDLVWFGGFIFNFWFPFLPENLWFQLIIIFSGWADSVNQRIWFSMVKTGHAPFQRSPEWISDELHGGFPKSGVPLSHPFWSLISTKNQAFWASFSHIVEMMTVDVATLLDFRLMPDPRIAWTPRIMTSPSNRWTGRILGPGGSKKGAELGRWGVFFRRCSSPRWVGVACSAEISGKHGKTRFNSLWLLTSGCSESPSISESSKVGDLKTLAQKPFGHGFSRLVTAEASILRDPMQTLQAAGLQDGDQLTANVGELKLASTEDAFSLWCCGGDGVVTWGHLVVTADSSAVQDQLRSVQASSGNRSSICCNLGRRLCCYLGRYTFWWL